MRINRLQGFYQPVLSIISKKAQNFPLSPKTCLFNPKNRGNYNEKEVAISRNLLIFSAPSGIELLNLWNDFRKVVKFIDENQTWLRPLMDRVASNKKAEEK